jgi:hypothetical protein
MIVSSFEREEAPNSISGYRELVDKWNSFMNSSLTDSKIDSMFELYANIKIWEHTHYWDSEFENELINNKERYKLKKYSFIHEYDK